MRQCIKQTELLPPITDFSKSLTSLTAAPQTLIAGLRWNTRPFKSKSPTSAGLWKIYKVKSVDEWASTTCLLRLSENNIYKIKNTVSITISPTKPKKSRRRGWPQEENKTTRFAFSLFNFPSEYFYHFLCKELEKHYYHCLANRRNFFFPRTFAEPPCARPDWIYKQFASGFSFILSAFRRPRRLRGRFSHAPARPESSWPL